MNQTAQGSDQEVARGVLESLGEYRVVLSVPGTDYQIHLAPAVPAAQLTTPLGKRIKGTIHVNALRIFKARGGGRFIEPIWGEPRIVAGFVLAVDAAKRRILVDVAVPMWMTLDERQDPGLFSVGDLVNCYVASGATFTPSNSHG